MLSLSLFPVDPTLEHRASVKRFLSLHFLNPKTVGRTPWTGDQPVARPLPTQDSTNTEQRKTVIHALSGIRTYDPSVRASEDSSCFRPRGQCERRKLYRREKLAPVGNRIPAFIPSLYRMGYPGYHYGRFGLVNCYWPLPAQSFWFRAPSG
jgi:hypothetical protein